VLFDSKLAEIERHIAYIRAACETRRANAHPNLAERLHLIVEALDALIPTVDAVRQDLALYHAAPAPAFDIWRQIFARFTKLTNLVLFLRTLLN